jgi:hypothetical protein
LAWFVILFDSHDSLQKPALTNSRTTGPVADDAEPFADDRGHFADERESQAKFVWEFPKKCL